MSITSINLEKTKYQKKGGSERKERAIQFKVGSSICFCLFAQEVEVIYSGITLAELRITYRDCEIHKCLSPDPSHSESLDLRHELLRHFCCKSNVKASLETT